MAVEMYNGTVCCNCSYSMTAFQKKKKFHKCKHISQELLLLKKLVKVIIKNLICSVVKEISCRVFISTFAGMSAILHPMSPLLLLPIIRARGRKTQRRSKQKSSQSNPRLYKRESLTCPIQAPCRLQWIMGESIVNMIFPLTQMTLVLDSHPH